MHVISTKILRLYELLMVHAEILMGIAKVRVQKNWINQCQNSFQNVGRVPKKKI